MLAVLACRLVMMVMLVAGVVRLGLDVRLVIFVDFWMVQVASYCHCGMIVITGATIE